MTTLITERTPRALLRIMDWAQRTPGGGWPLVALLFLVLFISPHLIAWTAGFLPRGEFEALYSLPALFITYNLVVWRWMDHLAENTFNDFGRALRLPSKRVAALLTDFVSLRPSTTWLTLALSLVFALGFAALTGPLFGTTSGVLYFSYVFFSVLPTPHWFLSIVRQARQILRINALFAEIKTINLFNLWPVYLLSRYAYNLALIPVGSAAMAISILMLDEPNELIYLMCIYIGSVAVLLSLFIFLAPLIGINRRLRREKERILQELGDEQKILFNEVKSAVKSRKSSKITQAREAFAALQEQSEAVRKIPTWPWNPGTLRNLFLPILLPLAVAVIQRYLFSALGF